MSRCLLISFALLLISEFNLHAQTTHPPRLDMDGVKFQLLYSSSRFSSWDFNDFLSHSDAGSSHFIFLPAGTTLVQSGHANEYAVSLQLTFTPINQKTAEANHKRELQLGLKYFPGNEIYSSYFKRVDTDSSFEEEGYSYDLVERELSFDAAYLFKTNPGNGIDFFGGLGIAIGYPVSSIIRARFGYGASSTSYDSICNCEIISDAMASADTVYQAVSSVFLHSYIPLGLEFRVLKNFRFTLEEDIGLSWQIFSHASNVMRFQYATGIGLKYLW